MCAFYVLDEAFLFIDKNKINSEVQIHLEAANITILPYDYITTMIADMTRNKGQVLWIDAKKTNYAIYR